MGFLPWAEPAPEQLLEAQPARCHRPERGNLDDHDVRHLSVQLLRDLQQTVHRPWVAAVAHIRNLGPDIPGFLIEQPHIGLLAEVGLLDLPDEGQDDLLQLLEQGDLRLDVLHLFA